LNHFLKQDLDKASHGFSDALRALSTPKVGDGLSIGAFLKVVFGPIPLAVKLMQAVIK
jgi:hypothetical protein